MVKKAWAINQIMVYVWFSWLKDIEAYVSLLVPEPPAPAKQAQA
jgi:hypothetical protein